MDEIHKLKSKLGFGSNRPHTHSNSAPDGWTPIHYPAQPPSAPGQPQQAPTYYPQRQQSYMGQGAPYYAPYQSQAFPSAPSHRPAQQGEYDESGYDMVHDRPPPPIRSSRPDQAPPVTAPRPEVIGFSSDRPKAGALYRAGHYPTPDLFPYALTPRVLVLSSPQFGYTSESIQNALDSLGPHSTLYLPAKTRWRASKTIWVKPHQEIATEGYPRSEEDIAWMDADEQCTGHLLSAANQPGVRIRNLGFDGGREKYGYNKENDAIIQLGNSSGHNQHIDHCMIRHPRQWSCLQVFQGSEGVRVTNNLIGPAGYDENSSLEGSGKWADGISYAGQSGLIAGNRIEDATDGGIVIFGAPGTLVTSNTIVNCCRMGLGAINMVDYGPHDGNYDGTRVLHNTILLDGAYIKIGIGQGPSVWFTPPDDRPRDYNRGAVVKYNLITTSGDEEVGGVTMGYGFAVTDVEDWICDDNEVHSLVEFGGDLSHVSKDPRRQSLGPGPFVALRAMEGQGPRNDTRLQTQFISGPIGRLLDVKPGESSSRVFWPGQVSLPMGGRPIKLKELELTFDSDGAIRLIHDTTDTLWEAHVPGAANSSASLIFDEKSKHLVVVDSHRHSTLIDFTPLSSPSSEVFLTLSDKHPHMVLASGTTGSVYFAPTGYRAEFQWEARVGEVIVVGGIEACLNRRGEYVISRGGQELWKSHESLSGDDDPSSHMIWQGDGNLVIYSGKDGNSPWSSGSCGRRPEAKYVVWGTEEPYLRCVAEGGEIIWASGRGLVR